MFHLIGDAEGGDEEVDNNLKTIPEVVISLDATDDFLKERVMNLPQKEVEGTHNTESGKYYFMCGSLQN